MGAGPGLGRVGQVQGGRGLPGRGGARSQVGHCGQLSSDLCQSKLVKKMVSIMTVIYANLFWGRGGGVKKISPKIIYIFLYHKLPPLTKVPRPRSSVETPDFTESGMKTRPRPEGKSARRRHTGKANAVY